MANKSFNSFILIIIALFSAFAIAAIISNMDFGNSIEKGEIPLEYLDSIMIAGDDALVAAETEFRVNPVIEGIVILNHRGKEFGFIKHHPLEDTSFVAKNEKADILFSGFFPKESDPVELKLKFYSNDESAFNNDLALLEVELHTDVGEKGEVYFNKILQVNFSPGLYYYILETNEEEKLITGGRFKILK